MGFLTSSIRIAASAIALAAIVSACQVIRLPDPARARPGEWSVAGSGPGRNGVVEREIAPPLRRAWRYSATAAFGPGGAIVLDGFVLAANRKGEVHAVRIDNGRKAGMANFRQPIEGNPVVSGSTLLVTTAWGTRTVQAYDLAKGERRWSLKAPPVDAGPVLAGPMLVVAAADGSLRGLHVEDGRIAWTDEGLGTPVTAGLTAGPDGTVFVADERGIVRAIRGSDGVERWRRTVGAPVYEATTWIDGELYVPTSRGLLLRLDAATGRIAWQARLGGETVKLPPVAVAGDLVVAGTTDGSVFGLDRSTGAVRWEARLEDGVSTQPLVAGRIAWVGTLGRDLVALSLDGGEELWSVELPGRSKSTLAAHGDGILVLSEPQDVLYFVAEENDARD